MMLSHNSAIGVALGVEVIASLLCKFTLCQRLPTTHPEGSHSVDGHRLLYKAVGRVHKLLAGHNACIVDQDVNVSNVLLYLADQQKRITQFARKESI